jgi:hypothetical protein
MALNWKSVTAEHVRQACRRVSDASRTVKSSGIIVWDGDRSLSAKEVLRVAYRLANGLPDSTELRFSSGDGSISILRRLGFRAERVI